MIRNMFPLRRPDDLKTQERCNQKATIAPVSRPATVA